MFENTSLSKCSLDILWNILHAHAKWILECEQIVAIFKKLCHTSCKKKKTKNQSAVWNCGYSQE